MDKTTEQMIADLYTIMLGVPGTDEGGMSERSKEMVKRCVSIENHLKELNGAVTRNTTWRKAFCWALGLVSGGFGVFAAWTIAG